MDRNTKKHIRKIIVIDDQASIHEDFKKILLLNNQSKKQEVLDIADQILNKKSSPEQNNNNKEIKYNVDSAFQGEEGYKLVETAIKNQTPYHLAFVDMRMPPGWDGLKTIEHIFKTDKNIQVVISTAYSDCSYEEISERLGETDRLLILKKPFDKIEVKQIASNLTEKWILSHYANLKMEEFEHQVDEKTKHIKDIERQLYQSSKLAALGELAGGVAHELNNPLSIILSNMELLEDVLKENNLHESTKNYSEKVFNSIDRMTRIIDHLKTFCNSRPGEVFEINLNLLIDSGLLLVGKQLESRGIEIIKEFQQKNISIVCDKNQIEQVLINLFINARDAMEKSEKKELQIKTSIDNENIILTVEDTGSGIKNDDKEKIFNPFFTTKETGKGTGLGLSISYNILKEHNANISVESAIDKGTKFTIKFPKPTI